MMFEPLEPRALLSSSLEPDGRLALDVSGEVRSVVSVDVTGDGIDDLVVSTGKAVRVRPGRANGSLARAYTAAEFSSNAGLLAAGDFDGDGRTDLASAQVAGRRFDAGGALGRAGAWVRILLGRPGGRFERGPMLRIDERAGTFAAASFDADRRDELLLNGLVLEVRGGKRNLRLVAERAAPGIVRGSAAADLNGDGLAEIVTLTGVPAGEVGPRTITVHQNLGARGFVPAGSRAFMPDGGQVDSLALGDLGGDGTAEVVFTQKVVPSTPQGDIEARVGVMSAVGLTLSEPVIVHTRPAARVSFPTEIREFGQWIVGVTDINADGRADILTASTLATYTGRGSGHNVRTELRPLLGRADGAFTAYASNELHRGSYYSPEVAATTPERLPSYFLSSAGAGPRRARGAGPDLVIVNIQAGPRDGWRVSRVRNTQAWKAPETTYVGLTRATPAPGSGEIEVGPGQVVMGDVVWGYARAVNFEQMRGATITGVRFWLDSNGDERLDAADAALGDAEQVVNSPDGSWRLRGLSVDAAWLAAARGPERLVTIFAVATDSTGISSAATAATSRLITL